ncbi:MAG: PTS fructose transporter subunit IIA [Gammaproteobacteria bacterium]
MSIGILLITHGTLGQDILDTVTMIMSQCPLQTGAISVGGDCNPDTEYEAACAACEALDQGHGVLVMTDLYGSTPSNIATRLLERYNVCVISGVSVPMLLRILNYPEAELDKLGEIAVEGAHNGVIVSSRRQAS